MQSDIELVEPSGEHAGTLLLGSPDEQQLVLLYRIYAAATDRQIALLRQVYDLAVGLNMHDTAAQFLALIDGQRRILATVQSAVLQVCAHLGTA